MADDGRPLDVPQIPPDLDGSISEAKARTLSRRHGPVLGLAVGEDGSVGWDWPFPEQEGRDWKWLIVDAFGTRNANVAACFVNHLVGLCERRLHEDGETWVPDEGELAMLLHVISAQQPTNEAQAALAAQIAATHLLTMKVAKRVADYPWDTRMIGAFARLTQASASQIDAMTGLKGKRRTTRQHITVSQEKHIHHHQHVHVGGGDDQKEGQPHGSTDRLTGRETRRARLAGKRAALPGPAKARPRSV